ncbi:neural-cadherin-like [Palaemon carinicauda]|uniref:neural-cadherin-like n=1 Tax=Palaemon carinicauda TaxID=392227 RepID=UPI0035B61810
MAANVLLPILFPLSDELDFPNVTKFLRIGLADKNDHPPFFEQSLYEVELEEDEAINQTLLTLSAKDLDEASQMFYEIVEGNEDKTFAIGNMTGQLVLAKPLDYEKRKKYDLRLVVSDGRHESDASIIINIRDINDNPPVFVRHLFEAWIAEEDDRNLPMHVLTVAVTDGDFDREKNIVFSLSGQGIDVENPENSHFEIVPSTGEIFVKKPLDRDFPRGRPSWGLTVFAQDEGGTGLVGYSEVAVHLRDVNDNPPVFLQVVCYGNVTENGVYGQEVVTMKADDYDDPNENENARLTYSIEKNAIDENTARPLFMIEPDTGVVRTAVCCLDREKTPEYSIQVVAMDGGGLKGTGTASIRILDVNDRPPRFTREEWAIEIEETSESLLPKAPILTVSVQDEDETNTFSYKVITSSGYGADKFSIVTNEDGTGSIMVVKPLDFEDPRHNKGFRFQIEVSDLGDDGYHDPYHNAHSWVDIKLKDINDNKPQFIHPITDIQVSENIAVGRKLFDITAIDPDNEGRSNITYLIDRISDKQRHFHIDGSGFVSVQRPLDREATPYHVIKILAVDDGVPAMTATNTLTISIMDVNDNAPKFLEDYHPVLPENQSPRMFAEIRAIDVDDRLEGNGPPFLFELSPLASVDIKDSFRVTNIPEGANGEGIAVISSLRKFDREVQKEFHIPISIRDSGSPPMIGTSTLTVIIGDVNDNEMKSGEKDILFYSYKGRAHETRVGRVYVHDADDWDLEDKKFTWAMSPHPNFLLNEDSGMITMKYATSETSYELEFYVHDIRHLQLKTKAKVVVKVRHVSEIAVENAGSVRINGISDEDFISQWNYRTKKPKRSVAYYFQEKIAKILNVSTYSIDLFSIHSRQKSPPVTDIFFSVFESQYFTSVELNGLLMLHRYDIENELGLSISMIGIDECFHENVHCVGSCTSKLEVLRPQYLVDANRTSFVGVQTKVYPVCECSARDFSSRESCRPNPCLNKGMCIEEGTSISCTCPEGYSGPRCQLLTRSFQGNGFAWFPSLKACEKSHISVEFFTQHFQGLIFYNGPLLSANASRRNVTKDFIALEITNGKLRFLINFGSGTLQLKVNSTRALNDGKWHKADIFWNKETARIVVDQCADALVLENTRNMDQSTNISSCQAHGKIPPFHEYLNVNSPLQVGGMAQQPHFLSSVYNGDEIPLGHPFQGCIRNLMVNSYMYDLANPGLQTNSRNGCSYFEKSCHKNASQSGCGPNGICDGSITDPFCLCKPGWTGTYCEEPTVPAFFEAQSYVKYSLSFKPNAFHKTIQLRFRTWANKGDLVRITNQLSQKHEILEIKDKNLQYCFTSNISKEKCLCLSSIIVSDGKWHVARVERFGSVLILSLDGGEGRRYNETSLFSESVLMDIDEKEGLYVGGRVHYTDANIFSVRNDYNQGCLDDLRVDGKAMPLPPAHTGTQWAQASMFHNIASGCISPNQCLNITCIAPFVCKDLWMKHECSCPNGTSLSKDHLICLDEDVCFSGPCKNGGICHNQKPSYVCQCPEGFKGNNCQMKEEISSLHPSVTSMAAITVCIITVVALLAAFLLCLHLRRQRMQRQDSGKKNDADVDREMKCGAEGEVTVLDLTAMNVPPVSVVTNGGNIISRGGRHDAPLNTGITNVDVIVCKHEENSFGNVPQPLHWQDLGSYIRDGGESSVTYLQSLG